ncbi:hypothetical protein AO364_1106 [Moraxella catarrhalis]|nr:hypothetical protein AO364_1106 [Moraxella catarrhalis]
MVMKFVKPVHGYVINAMISTSDFPADVGDGICIITLHPSGNRKAGTMSDFHLIQQIAVKNNRLI